MMYTKSSDSGYDYYLFPKDVISLIEKINWLKSEYPTDDIILLEDGNIELYDDWRE